MTWTRAALCRTLPALLAVWLGACFENEPVPPDCTGLDCEQNQEPIRCICADIYQPVCGKDGKTYGNACEAACTKTPVVYEGECKPAPEPEPSCICPAIYKPVCGSDGKTYGNACEAACAKVPVAHDGECTDAGCAPSCKGNADCGKGDICFPPTRECQPECSIACLIYDPVCGTDGQTYGCGQADAHCHGVEVASPGECAPNACKTDEDCPHGYCDRGVSCAAVGCPAPPPNRCKVCGDGSELLCKRALLPCPDGQVREIVGSCYGECVDRYTCSAPASGCTFDGKQYKVGEAFPSSDGCNSCSCTEGGLVACTLKACTCDYSAPERRWVAKSAEQCKLVKFACPTGQRAFFNECGCGCEPDPVKCRVGGCSGQLCVGPGEPDISTCEWREEYACYRTASCAPQADGRCGWTQTDALRQCLDTSR